MRMEQSTDETEQSAIPSSPIIATVGGISSRVRESAPYGAPEQECCLTSRSRCLQEQARQHEGLDAMRNGASTTSLMCSDRRRSRLIQKRTRRIHAASQRQRGVRNRGRLTGGRERGGQGEVPRGLMEVAAEASLDDKVKASLGQAQSGRELEAGMSIADRTAGFGFIR